MLVPGHPEKSGLVQIIKSGEMPKKGKPMPEAELAVIEKWIAQGAKTAKPEPLTLAPGPMISDEDREFWAFQPVNRAPVPMVKNASRVRTPVDAFLLAKMQPAGLDFAPEADRRTLIRRVSLNLTGLLPKPEEVEAFVADPSPLAYENLVEAAAGLKKLWRALGPALAGCRGLCRLQWLHGSRYRASPCLALS